MENTEKLKNYIWQQLQTGLTADEISGHLKAVGWNDEQIQAAFSLIQSNVTPTIQNTAAVNQSAPSSAVGKRGRFKTSWLLLRQSWTVLMGNKYLLRYMWLTVMWGLLVVIVFGTIFYFADNSLFNQNDYGANPDSPQALGYLLIFIYYLIFYFAVNYFAAAMTYAVLDIFEGRRRSYSEYMALARSKAMPLFIFSLFDASVGVILSYVIERIPVLGKIIEWLFGTLWSLGNMFTIPYIVTSESSAPAAIKQSITLFKSTWGENIMAKASVNIPLFFIYMAIIAVFFITFITVAFSGSYFLMMADIIGFYLVLMFVWLIGAFANNLVSVALFYYATKKTIPPVFNEELLNKVFIKRKRRFFRKVE